MKIFLDSADVSEIESHIASGFVDGVTTNPSLIAKAGRNILETITEICGMVDGPVSAEVAATGNKNARSDAGVAALTAQASAEGAFYNVLINLDGFDDEAYAAAATTRAEAALAEVTERVAALTEAIRAQLRG